MRVRRVLQQVMMPRCSQSDLISPRGGGDTSPAMCTSTTAAVCGVRAAVMVFGLSANVAASMSANTGRALTRRIAAAVA